MYRRVTFEAIKKVMLVRVLATGVKLHLTTAFNLQNELVQEMEGPRVGRGLGVGVGGETLET